MTLELLSTLSYGRAKPVKLLFIHGICTAAWIWDIHFLRHFAELGYDSYALSLRGHGESEGSDKVRQFSLADFANDVEWAIKRIGGPIVVVGYSLGGAVVQNYLRRGGRPAGTVHLNSVPPHGLLRALAVMLIEDPQLAHELNRAITYGVASVDIEVFERGLFSRPPPPELRRIIEKQFNEVAQTASREAMGWVPFAPFPWNLQKLLVIGGERDRFVPVADVRLTAMYYGTVSVIVPNGAHAIMMDVNWESAAAVIAGWLAKSFGDKR